LLQTPIAFGARPELAPALSHLIQMFHHNKDGIAAREQRWLRANMHRNCSTYLIPPTIPGGLNSIDLPDMGAPIVLLLLCLVASAVLRFRNKEAQAAQVVAARVHDGSVEAANAVGAATAWSAQQLEMHLHALQDAVQALSAATAPHLAHWDRQKHDPVATLSSTRYTL